MTWVLGKTTHAGINIARRHTNKKKACQPTIQLKAKMLSILVHLSMFSFFFYLFIFFKFYFIFKLYNIVLVLLNIEMNPPQIYLCSPSWTLLPPHTLPLGRPSASAPSIQYCASNLDWWLVSYIILYMFQCHSPKSPHPLPLPQSP